MKKVKKFIVPSIAGLCVIVAVGFGLYYYNQYRTVQKMLNNPNEVAKQETAAVVKEVGVLMQLPKNEEPSIATVLDATKLKDQPFFANAVNGDKVIIYTKSAKAILYRPSQHKIIEVAPITMTQPTPSAEPSTKPTVKVSPTVKPTVTPKPTVEVSPTP